MYKIRYFSATNNSKYYAYSLYEVMKKDIEDISYEFIDINGEEFKDDVLILFFPILYQRLPISLNTFINNSKFENTLIYVYAGSFDKLGIVLNDLKNALKEKDVTLASFKMIKSVSAEKYHLFALNYIIMAFRKKTFPHLARQSSIRSQFTSRAKS